ncbi:hypothetical protein C8A03DRAFT_31585 [Achaetomium macrosporum]|uniref:Uncharacterized protein n=1 Tax=Achaetomium macrosporum TaxID=79813 RepID=A0AAN7CFC4_9PEZI|nr:hypothetical protein C8A03DRAFT_31585 [Achaetomium macrosporum]
MKFSAATAMVLGMAPQALGKAVHNVYPGRRSMHEQVVSVNQVSTNSIKASQDQIAELQRLIGLQTGQGTTINFLWVNLGGGAATTVIGAASTVTVTQTVVGGEATAPPAVTTGEAATTTAAAPPTGTTVVAGGATHSVTVGGPQGLAFDPPQLSANPGDTVIFTFLSQNHTATQSAFDKPCEPLAGGMDSGFQANPNNTINPPPQVAMQVMVSTPLWFYCRQKGHCGKGMVFSINPTAEKTHAQFQALAIQQAGSGTGSAITGGGEANASAGAGAGAGASASASASASPSASAGAGGDAAATTSAEASTPAATEVATATSGGIVTGTGTIAADGSCVCAVQCTIGGFPNAQMQGRDSFGGWGGAVPMPAVQAARFRA